MEPKNSVSQMPDGIVLLRILFRNYKQILLITALATTGAFIFSSPFFIPKYYKSEVIFYPPNTNSNKILIERDPRFGSDREIDEQTQIIKSSIVRDSVIEKYNLISHYEIDTLKPTWRSRINKIFNDNIKIGRTTFGSITVVVYDTDPVLAARIANDIVKIADRVKADIIKGSFRMAFSQIAKECIDKSLEIDEIVQGLNQFMDKPISIRVTQKDKTYTENLKEQYDIQAALDKARKGGNLKEIQIIYNYQLKLQQLNEIQNTYFQASVSINRSIPECYIITPGEISYINDGPRRTIIVFVTFFSSLLSGICLVLLIEKFKTLRQLIIMP